MLYGMSLYMCALVLSSHAYFPSKYNIMIIKIMHDTLTNYASFFRKV